MSEENKRPMKSWGFTEDNINKMLVNVEFDKVTHAWIKIQDEVITKVTYLLDEFYPLLRLKMTDVEARFLLDTMIKKIVFLIASSESHSYYLEQSLQSASWANWSLCDKIDVLEK